MNFDLSILTWMQQFFGPESWHVWNWITDLGSPPFLILIIGMTLWIGGTARGLRLLFATMASSVIVGFLKVLIMQPRPYYIYEDVQAWRDSTGFGMPSGHASGAMSLWGTLVLSLRRQWVFALSMLLVFLIGISRVYFGVHSPSQILIGWGIGLGILFAIQCGEKRAIRIFKSLRLGGQLALALGTLLLMLGLQATFIDGRAANFETPTQWTERYHEARIFEATVAGEVEDRFPPLELFGTFETDNVGAVFGMWLVAIYVARFGGFEGFSRRQKIVNVVLGLSWVALLLPIIELVEHSFGLGLLVWTSIPVMLGVGIPVLGSRVCRRFGWSQSMVVPNNTMLGGTKVGVQPSE